MAKKPTGGLIKGEKKKKIGKKPGKAEEEILAKNPTGGLTRGDPPI